MQANMNTTVTTDPRFSSSSRLPVTGYPGPIFYILHITGISSLTISIIFSMGVMLRLLCPCQCDIWKHGIGERLAMYLAVCDLAWSVTHEMDHSYMIVTHDHPPDKVCAGFAFIMLWCMCAQAIIVTFTAFNAFVLVVREKHVNFGRYDWRLTVPCLLISFGLSMIPAVLNILGPTGAW